MSTLTPSTANAGDETASREGGKRSPNWKTVVGLIIPTVPIVIVALAILRRRFVMYDVDAPVVVVMLVSPLFLVFGAIISLVSLVRHTHKALSLLGLALNITELGLIIHYWRGPG